MVFDDKVKVGDRPHGLVLDDRSRLSITGVEDVDSFDDKQIILRTTRGSLILRGEQLHIDKLSLDTGDMAVTGLITDLGYEEAAPGGSLWSRLFK